MLEILHKNHGSDNNAYNTSTSIYSHDISHILCDIFQFMMPQESFSWLKLPAWKFDVSNKTYIVISLSSNT